LGDSIADPKAIGALVSPAVQIRPPRNNNWTARA